MFWTVHIIHIWITVDLPNVTFTKKLKTHSKVVHIAVVSACILLSIIGPIVALAKYSYVVIRVPALTCSPNDLDFVFYTLILPCVLLIATSTSFLVLLFWTVYKVCIELYMAEPCAHVYNSTSSSCKSVCECVSSCKSVCECIQFVQISV